MIPIQADDFTTLFAAIASLLREAPPVKTERWQGVAANTDTFEMRNVCFEVPLQSKDPDPYRHDVRPNLPWADDHFLERVCGEPINPGVEWANWPYGRAAAAHREKQGRFNHNYMERLWPKFARRTEDGRLPAGSPTSVRRYPQADPRPKFGIAHHYGDLEDLVDLLAREPHTRQGWIPLFFPEDTGVGDGGRKPCTLGYQVVVRDGRAHMYYPLRSCDFRRHFRDDVYMAIRLLLWVRDQCATRSEAWGKILPGSLCMHMTSLHVFATDRDWLEAYDPHLPPVP